MSGEQRRRSLTGIKPSGTPHVGNYLGAIVPALELAQHHDALYFIADYHALTTVQDGARMRALTYELAATWLACGLDPEQVVFCRQSDVPEVFELSWVLGCFAGKGLLNRAHAYKAQVQENEQAGRDLDDGVSMGLFTYPVLMAADILLYDTDVVPVGQDQRQHVEIARDIAASLNHAYGAPVLRLPEPRIDEQVMTVTGLDGRKMSKSYDNVIPLFAPPKRLRKLVMSIVTDSTPVEDPKDPDTCNVFALYRLFASAEDSAALAERYRAGGMGYGEAKGALFDAMESRLAPLRSRYEEIIADTGELDRILADGAERARALAAPTMQRVRDAIGVGAAGRTPVAGA
jgi:tryptophanyl-tRNA synthetase